MFPKVACDYITWTCVTLFTSMTVCRVAAGEQGNLMSFHYCRTRATCVSHGLGGVWSVGLAVKKRKGETVIST